MQCPICAFENGPGVAVCTRCRSQLVADGPVHGAELTPPRAGVARVFRPLQYMLNRLVDRLPRVVPRPLARFFTSSLLPGEALAAMVLSAIPGLGHLVTERRRTALIGFFGWIVLLAVAAYLYGGGMSFLLVSFVISWHCYLIFDAGRVQQYARRATQRLRIMLVVLAAAGAAYFLLERFVRRYVDFVESAVAVPAIDVRAGDTLLLRAGPFVDGELSRGDVVGFALQGPVWLGHFYLEVPWGGLIIGRVAAVAGDRVEVSSSGIKVNGSTIDPAELPLGGVALPQGATALSMAVEEGRVYVPFRIGAGLDAYTAAYAWQHLFLVPVASIRGKALGVYLPVGRRRFFGSTALTSDASRRVQ